MCSSTLANYYHIYNITILLMPIKSENITQTISTSHLDSVPASVRAFLITCIMYIHLVRVRIYLLRNAYYISGDIGNVSALSMTWDKHDGLASCAKSKLSNLNNCMIICMSNIVVYIKVFKKRKETKMRFCYLEHAHTRGTLWKWEIQYSLSRCFRTSPTPKKKLR